MAKHIERTYEQGKYVCEWVDDVPPLREDRKTMMVPPPAIEDLVSRIEENVSDKKLVEQLRDTIAELRSGMFILPAMIMSTMVAKYGDGAWEDIEKMMYDAGYQRAKEISDTMNIDPKDARSVGRILDLEDSQNGVEGEWLETGKQRAVKREYYCAFANTAMLCPEICTRMITAMERGTLDGMGVKVKFALPKVLAKGDPYCECVLELED